ncbi:putative Type IV pilus biogenesis protein [Sterolibacterium denitrificans]|uniref:Type IV pilus biogenesis protein n=1 Tax=Sterolibacterium denitrificans TaxID=157592 RepID=A0A7Z7MWD5_9PROT|nr:PilC/PilY family type IV pilus protein [Sterolibacterium denitrificans]SMB29722.1 putative Type IV pilus biogenesis protein [Sterolibacterium denitrificans]
MTQQTHHRLHRALPGLRLLGLLACLLLPATPASAGVELAQQPLTVATAVEPNIMLILDDSGSMGWEHMPGTTANWYSNPVGGLPTTVSVNDIRLRAANINTMWYNPLITYEPWLKYDGSSYSNANYDGGNVAADPSGKSGSGTLNFKTKFTAWQNLSTSGTYSVGNSETMSTSTGLVSSNYQWRYGGFYYLTGSNEKTVTHYNRYDFIYGCSSGTSCNNSQKAWRARKVTLNTNGTDSSNVQLTGFDWTPYGGPTRTIQEEIQNYANWFSYYRLRITMAKAAASRVFAKLGSGYRIGFDTLQYNAKSKTPIFSIPVSSDDGRFSGANKQTWFTKLFAANSSDGTSLREALSRAGEYYSDTVNGAKGSSGPYGPESGAAQLSCRANFAILTTDGYWNGNAALNNEAQKDNDTQDGVEITGPNGRSYQYESKFPYKDSRSNTLADVAMYYWKTDLMPPSKDDEGMTNDVPTTAKNPAFWQHMRTYGISIGEKGTLDPKTDLPALTAGSKSWPAPGNDKQENIDDLWHAAVNSRGEFIVASNPDEFAKALTSTLNEIASETKHAASGGASSAKLEAGSMVYFSQYTSGAWNGRVYSQELDAGTGLPKSGGSTWDAEQKLPAWAQRKMRVNAGGTLKAFEFANLTAAQKAFLTSADTVNYLRGDTSKEEPTGSFRERSGLLPAFINSQLVYVGAPTHGDYYAAQSSTGASSYAGGLCQRQQDSHAGSVLYVSGSDGMLHGFNGKTGVETIAFLPSFSIGTTLQRYTDPRYGMNDINDPDWQTFRHRYILDGELTVADAYLSGWKTILVGTQGRGGTGVFALDVTNPDDIKFLWEKSAADNSALGNSLGKPVIAQVANGDWRVLLGNGPNSNGDRAQLIMISLTNGTITTVNTAAGGNNGLAGVNAIDSDGDGFFDTAYAGDLKGNVWRFTNLGGSPSADKLFTTTNNRPITTMPLVVKNEKTRQIWVFVGTGQFLNNADMSNTDQQTWYGLLDDGTEIGSRANLKERKILTTGSVSGTPVRTLEAGTAAEIINAGLRGWYIDFTYPGERMISPNTLLAGALFGITYVPDGTNRCQPDGKSSVWAINPFSGARLNQGIFDLTGDRKITAADKLDDVFPSVLDGLEAIMSGQPPIIQGKDGTATMHLPGKTIFLQLPIGQMGRQSWREIIAK